MKKLLIFVGIITVFCLYFIISNEMELRKMATTEGRQEVIAEKYENAVITSEKEVEGYIISAYEVGEEHGYAVFWPVEDGKYDLMTYSGSPREKSRLVFGTLDIVESSSYEVFVCSDENIEYLEVTILEMNGTKFKEHLLWGQYDLYLGQTKLSPNMDLSAFFRNNGSLSYGGLPDSTIYAMAQEALTNRGNYYNLHELVMKDAQLCPILTRSYAVYATRGLMTDLTPARDNVFFYTLGRSMDDAKDNG